MISIETLRWIGLVCLSLLLCGIYRTGAVEAACTVESSPGGKPGPLMKHLSPDCTKAEREAQVVSAASVMQALTQRQAVDLVGVVLQGDLIFDQLPVRKSQIPKGLTPEQQAALSALNDEEPRIVAGNLIIRDSVVDGALRHRSAKGTLEFEGTVDFHGTRFTDGVDLSRSVFQKSLAIDGALFEREAYFVQGHFAQGLSCAEAKFGPHTRFHRSVFRGPVDCQGSLFDGMAEFLEVVCEAPVNFERARFGLGTGFSGAHFKKLANFSDAIFSREAFFAFVVFSGEARFAGAQFLQAADFSNADFKRGDDLAKVRFDQKPLTNGTKGIAQEGAGKGGQSDFQQYAITLGILLVAAFLVAYAVKLK
ncbi:MAG: pentapeptide repeat-containing protein [Nitrospira sp.]|nr:pentapeptide repeat-containing protein [Nitrospira sp.]